MPLLRVCFGGAGGVVFMRERPETFGGSIPILYGALVVRVLWQLFR
jgi:hypothetical protein